MIPCEFTTLKIIALGFQGSRVPSPTPLDVTRATSLDKIPAVPHTARAKAPLRKKRTDYHKPIVLAQRRQNKQPNKLSSQGKSSVRVVKISSLVLY